LVAHRACGFTCWYFGDFAGAQRHFQKTIELYDQARHGDFANRFGQDPGSGVEIGDALTLWVLGRIDEALRLADRALADAESAAHAPTMGYVLTFAARLGLFRRSPEAVATYSRALADIVSRYDLPALWAGSAVFYQGWAKWSDAGRFPEAKWSGVPGSDIAAAYRNGERRLIPNGSDTLADRR
jgi:tetratricopeptide (TPR) repeat protein